MRPAIAARTFALTLALTLAGAAHALAADSLISSPRGDDKTFTLYYLHSLPDGATVIDERPVAIASRITASGKSNTLFDGPLDNLTIRWSPGGNLPPKDAPPNHEKKARLQLVLQGEFVVEVSNGRQVHVKPGQLLLQEDATGFGHTMHCDAPATGLGCVQLTMDAVDPATFFANVAR